MPGVRLFFMQSSGGLTEAHRFQGKDAILSGPAGGIVGMVRTAVAGGHRRVIGFDMGGTSHRRQPLRGRVRARVRDPGRRRAHARADDEHPHRRRRRRLDPAVRRRAAARRARERRRQPGAGELSPRRAAGGDRRQRDARQASSRAHFPKVFGPRGDEPLDRDGRGRASSRRWPPTSSAGTGRDATPEASGRRASCRSRCRTWPTRSSASRWRAATTSRSTRCSASAAPAASTPARWPTRLGMTRVFVHPLAGVLSAYGMGLADQIAMREASVELPLDAAGLAAAQSRLRELGGAARDELLAQGVDHDRAATAHSRALPGHRHRARGRRSAPSTPMRADVRGCVSPAFCVPDARSRAW